MEKVWLLIYYAVARWLPNSDCRFGGSFARRFRYFCCRHIFKSCGKNVNIERGAFFGNGRNIVVGDNSGIGVNAVIPNDIIIGRNVMMGPECYILVQNHEFSRIDVPMNSQGFKYPEHPTIIEDDVWIGREVTMTPGRTIRRGTIIGACTLLCKDFPEYSIVGGNPSKLIRSRI